MIFKELKKLIYTESKNNKNFQKSCEYIQEKIFKLNLEKIIPLIRNIGIIPESISHDSSEEKLYSKTSDILLAKAFQEIGLFSSINISRTNCADVVARSKINNYSLVADAKSFRLSRTAKNQKDFKVKSMIDWKGDHDFAVLVSPYYQYPKKESQIYGQALDGNICLLSWEHLVFFLENKIKETENYSLKNIWNLSEEIASNVTVKEKIKIQIFMSLVINYYQNILNLMLIYYIIALINPNL